MMLCGKRLLVASNRLPATIRKKGNAWMTYPGTGGLITALAPVMEVNGGLWVGWPEAEDNAAVRKSLRDFSKKHCYSLKPVWLSQREVERYYRGFSNETIWPLFHDLLGNCSFRRDNWEIYRQVNERFAKTIAAAVQKNDFIWVHDYQLMLVGHYLRRAKIKRPLAYFLHIPFPPLDLFRRLPWKQEIIEALMEYDLLGFQTLRDRRNFVQCVKGLQPRVQLEVRARYTLLRIGGRTVKVGHFPISIDFERFQEMARSKEVAEAAWFLHENIQGRQLMLGLDRLDYTKGISERFRALELALEKYPELQGNISLVQVLVPSRTHVPQYQKLKNRLDALTGRINGKFSRHGWVPIHYKYRRLDQVQLLGHYKACEIALVTPLRDGMNLVAKEYCACSIDNNGVLILSEFAGAAEQLAKDALIVNPYDVEGTADAIYQAYKMPLPERIRRMRSLRSIVKRSDVYQWLEWFLGAFQPAC